MPPRLRRLARRWPEAPLVAVAAGLMLAGWLLVGCTITAGDAMPRSTGVDPVVTGRTLAPIGAIDYCRRHPEELRCRPTVD